MTLLSCSQEESISATGPNGSFWVGGLDGGVYIFLQDDSNPDDTLFTGAIYYDWDKTLWYSGVFKFQGKNAFDVSDKDAYDGWDGINILLKNGDYLVAVDMPDGIPYVE